MPDVQQQAPHLPGAHPLCRQASVPRAGLDEHCRENVHQPVRRVGAVISRRIFLLSLYFNHFEKGESIAARCGVRGEFGFAFNQIHSESFDLASHCNAMNLLNSFSVLRSCRSIGGAILHLVTWKHLATLTTAATTTITTGLDTRLSWATVTSRWIAESLCGHKYSLRPHGSENA